jgi:lipid-A-disaccharide synthase
LELALRGVPSVVAYRTNPITAALVRRMLTIPHVALPNILAGEKVMAEFLQENCQPQPIAKALSDLLDDSGHRARQQEKFAHISGLLGRDGIAPSLRAADAILGLMDGRIDK